MRKAKSSFSLSSCLLLHQNPLRSNGFYFTCLFVELHDTFLRCYHHLKGKCVISESLYATGKEGFLIRYCLDQFSPAPQNAIGVSVTILGWSGCSNHYVCHQHSRFSRKTVYKWLTYSCLCIFNILKCYFFTFKFLTILMSKKIGSKIVIGGKHLHQQQSSLMKLQSK